MTVGGDLLVGLAAQHVDQVLRTEGVTAGPGAAVDAGQELLRQHGAVDGLRGRQAVVAVAAGLGVLTKIGQQAHATAVGGFAQRQHGIQLAALQPLEFLAGFRRLDEASLLHHVVQAIGHPDFSRQAITASTPGLLVIGLDGTRQIHVCHEAHIRLVDAHAEGDGRHDDHAVLTLEGGLHVAAFGGLQAGMVGTGVKALLLQEGRHLLGAVARRAVDDARFPLVAIADEAQQLLVAIALLDDPVADVGAVEAGDEGLGILQGQPVDDLAAGEIVGGGGERNTRHRRELVCQPAQTDVLGPKVVSPLRDAVRLVNGDQCQLTAMQQRQTSLGQQTLRGHVQQLQFPLAQLTLDVGCLGCRQRGIEVGRCHTQLAQRRHLVLHQRNQRRNDNAHALAHQCRNLIAQRLAAPGGHQHQRVAATGHVFDDVVLQPPERRVAEHLVQDVFGVHPVFRVLRGNAGAVAAGWPASLRSARPADAAGAG